MISGTIEFQGAEPPRPTGRRPSPPLNDLSLDSLDIVEVVMAFEDEFGKFVVERHMTVISEF